MTTSVPDYDDLPDTSDLEPPTSDEVPIAVLANTLAIRSLRKELKADRKERADVIGAVKTWGMRIVAALIGGAVTMATAVVSVAAERGAEQERDRQQTVEIGRNSDRISRLEQKAWEDR